MSTIKYILLFTSFSLLLQCNMQNRNDRGTIIEAVDAISPGVPFTIDREDGYLRLPKNFADENIKGILGLTVYIDNAGNLQGFKIMKLSIEFNGKNDINYINKTGINRPFLESEYPKEVQQYYQIIENYVYGLRFERDERMPIKKLNEITFMARIK